MKRFSIIAAAFVAAVASLSASAQEVLLDKVVAIVSEDVITANQLEQMLGQVRFNAARAEQELPPEQELREEVLNRLIEESLQLQLAKRMGFQVSDTQLENTIDNILASEEKTRQELTEELAEAGQSYAQFREEVRNEIVIGEISRSQVRRRINVSEQEVDALVEMMQAEGNQGVRYHIAHIMVRDQGSEEADMALAAEIAGRLEQGEDFNTLAATYSRGPKALEGGDWGWMAENEMPTLFSNALKDPAPGELIGPFASSNGAHLIKVLDIEGQQRVETLEVNARHILVKPSIILSDAKAVELLTNLRQQVLNGEAAFADLARQFSEDPGSAVRGGELGWSDPRAYVPEFQKAAIEQTEGEISMPFKTAFGWHILQVTEKRTTDTTNEASRNRAQQMLFNRKFADESRNWLEELKEDAYIEILESEG
ncbi:peptidylprolyl isomerase [Aliagarivorans marinus]|uniref:peptidylprolyl isomerase n=1 Tax=Aliagarivorans marinus TaxID=561965 RepID=UPI000403FE10|nr:peptidylprolyl isomerase [Aliagarivorans marinus]